MPKFNKTIDELETRFDKWLYLIRNLNRLDKIPDKLREQIFLKLFETAEIAKFTADEARYYEDSLKYYRDLKNSLDTKFDEGRIEEKKDIALKLFKINMPIDDIIEITGLTKDELLKLKENY